MPTLLDGLASQLEASGNALRQEHRAEAAKALNDARRLARFLDKAVPDPVKPVAHEGREVVDAGRRALQNGAPDRAADILSAGSQSLRSKAAAASEAPSPLTPEKLDGLEGADVINAKGAKVGEIDRFTVGEDGRRYAVLKVGGWHDLLGFIDYGNKYVTIPLDRLLLGTSMAAITDDVTERNLANASGLPGSRLVSQ